MLWEMYWNLVDRYGYNAEHLRQLDDRRQQPGAAAGDGRHEVPGRAARASSDGRNAILQADVALTGGANQCEIWRGFAKRGLGLQRQPGQLARAAPTASRPSICRRACTAATFGGFTSAHRRAAGRERGQCRLDGAGEVHGGSHLDPHARRSRFAGGLLLDARADGGRAPAARLAGEHRSSAGRRGVSRQLADRPGVGRHLPSPDDQDAGSKRRRSPTSTSSEVPARGRSGTVPHIMARWARDRRAAERHGAHDVPTAVHHGRRGRDSRLFSVSANTRRDGAYDDRWGWVSTGPTASRRSTCPRAARRRPSAGSRHPSTGTGCQQRQRRSTVPVTFTVQADPSVSIALDSQAVFCSTLEPTGDAPQTLDSSGTTGLEQGRREVSPQLADRHGGCWHLPSPHESGCWQQATPSPNSASPEGDRAARSGVARKPPY